MSDSDPSVGDIYEASHQSADLLLFLLADILRDAARQDDPMANGDDEFAESLSTLRRFSTEIRPPSMLSEMWASVPRDPASAVAIVPDAWAASYHAAIFAAARSVWRSAWQIAADVECRRDPQNMDTWMPSGRIFDRADELYQRNASTVRGHLSSLPPISEGEHSRLTAELFREFAWCRYHRPIKAGFDGGPLASAAPAPNERETVILAVAPEKMTGQEIADAVRRRFGDEYGEFNSGFKATLATMRKVGWLALGERAVGRGSDGYSITTPGRDALRRSPHRDLAERGSNGLAIGRD